MSETFLRAFEESLVALLYPHVPESDRWSIACGPSDLLPLLEDIFEHLTVMADESTIRHSDDTHATTFMPVELIRRFRTEGAA